MEFQESEREDSREDMVPERLLFNPVIVDSMLLFIPSHFCSASVLIELTVVLMLD